MATKGSAPLPPQPSNEPAAPASAGVLMPYVEPIRFDDRIREVGGELSLDSIVVKSPFAHLKGDQQRDAIVAKFNKNVKESIIVNAGARAGERVDPGCFVVAHKNRIPEMRAGTGERFALQLTAGYTEIGYLGRKDGIYKQNEPLIGDFGTYVVNVPTSCYAKVWSGNSPMLLAEGPHVINDPLFRVEDGVENGRPKFIVDVSSERIFHGNLRIVRVKVGEFAKVTVNTQAVLLPYRAQPYVFETPLFEFVGSSKQSDPYICHGPLHLLRVPAGSVAKCWQGSKALLLEYRDEPYHFDDPVFRFDPRDGFVDAQTKHIRHGSLNRLRPGVKGDLEKAVIQHDGELQFVDRFTTIDNAHHAVLGFLNMGLQTCIFPSKETRAERLKENPRASPDEINYEPMTTQDSLKMGMKLLVAFQVKDQHLVMRKLRLSDIVPHVENLCVSDMVRAVQHTTSGNFLNASRAREGSESATDHVVDMVRDELRHHLSECGLELVRFSVEEAKVLDEEIAKEMARQSLVAATANAEQAVIKQKTAIAQSKAELEAMARRVEQDQENKIRISAAEAELEAAKLRAQAQLVEADARAKAMSMEAEVLTKFPALLHLRLAQLQAESLKGSNVSFVAPELEKSAFWMLNPANMGMRPSATNPA